MACVHKLHFLTMFGPFHHVTLISHTDFKYEALEICQPLLPRKAELQKMTMFTNKGLTVIFN